MNRSKNWKRKKKEKKKQNRKRQGKGPERGESQRCERSESRSRRDSGFSLRYRWNRSRFTATPDTHILVSSNWAALVARIPANNGQLIRYRDRLHTNAGIKYLVRGQVGACSLANPRAGCSFVPLFFACIRRRGEGEAKRRNAYRYVGRLSFADRRPGGIARYARDNFANCHRRDAARILSLVPRHLSSFFPSSLSTRENLSSVATW